MTGTHGSPSLDVRVGIGRALEAGIVLERAWRREIRLFTPGRRTYGSRRRGRMAGADRRPPQTMPNPEHRGAHVNPVQRFQALHREPDPDSTLDPAEEPLPRTRFIPDESVSILSRNDSPDLGFTWSVNPYRGCEHGCAYCYARPTHEYLGLGAGIDFESRILVKHRAPELLREALSKSSWKPELIALSGVTDPYQPIERKLQITRRCLEVLAEFRNPVGIVTKNALITRDIDLLASLSRHHAVVTFISVTTLDPELRGAMEPRTSPPAARLKAIRRLADAGIPVGVLVAPIIPAVNDHEIPRVLEAAARAGATYAGHVVLRLPLAVAPVFEEWLRGHLPQRAEKVLGQIRAMRGGRLNDSDFGTRMAGSGILAEQIHRMFDVAARKVGMGRPPEPSSSSFRRVEAGQSELW